MNPEPSLQVSFEGPQGLKVVRLRDSAAGTMAVTDDGVQDGGAPVDQAKPLSASERQELIELRRRFKQVQQERDILTKATAWFAAKSEKTSGPSTNW